MAKKIPFTVERTFKSSPTILYNFLTTPSGLVQWFADYVDLDPNGEVFTLNGMVMNKLLKF
ncbi:MAG: START-like domain-containing protein [Chitinophagales bacterium]